MPDVAASIEDLAWLVGRWVGTGLGGEVEEIYSPAVGGQMVGHFRHVRSDVPVFYELFAIVQVGKTLEYRVKHFDPDLRGWERQDAYDCFHLLEAEPGRWVFDKSMIERVSSSVNRQAVRESPLEEWNGHFEFHRMTE